MEDNKLIKVTNVEFYNISLVPSGYLYAYFVKRNAESKVEGKKCSRALTLHILGSENSTPRNN